MSPLGGLQGSSLPQLTAARSLSSSKARRRRSSSPPPQSGGPLSRSTYRYWRPTWRLGTEHAGHNASVRAAISPELVLLVWQAVPLEVKPKVVLGA